MSAINEKVFVDINSSKQGMFIRGEDATSPVLLFLHGGPGSPEHGMTMAIEDADNRLENCFVVCYWDQRGAGMSFHSSINPETMTLHQMIEDTAAVTRYLQTRFGQEKIYLFGHSWGSYLGIKNIERYPQLYHALINVGQVCDQIQSEKLAYTYMLAYARKSGDKRAEKQLLRFDISADGFPDTKYVQGVRSSLMNKYGIGIIHDKNIATMKGLIRNLFLFKGYTLREKINYLRGLTFSQKLLHLSI